MLIPHNFQNILIKSHPPNVWWIKIADFGISKRIEEGNRPLSTLCGTQGYIAPEMYGFVKGDSVYATDIWAFGEIVFQLLTKKPTFKHLGLLANYIPQPDTFPSEELANFNVSTTGIDFILALMHPLPTKRLTASSALLHGWIKSATDIDKLPIKLDPSHTSMEEKSDTLTEDNFATWNTRSIRPKPAQNTIPGKT